MENESKKQVDQEWKSQVSKEKQEAQENNSAYHQPTFSVFLSSLSMQAMIALGKLENPITNNLECNLEQARYLIDTLEVLQEKTKSNLTEQEEALLNEALYNLRMVYIEEKGKVKQ